MENMNVNPEVEVVQVAAEISVETEKAEPQVESPRQQLKELAPILLDDRGRVIAKNNSELLRYCGAMVMAGAVPKWFDTPQKLFGALMFARSLNLPDAAIRNIANIHGVMSIFGDLPLSLVQSSGLLSGFKEQWFDKDYEVICFENKNLTAEAFGAVSFMSRNEEEIQSFSFTIDDARKAGLYPASKAGMPWDKYTKIMMRYKARAIGLKSLFADKINGVSILEYDLDTNDPTEAKDVTPEQGLAEALNKDAGPIQ